MSPRSPKHSSGQSALADRAWLVVPRFWLIALICALLAPWLVVWHLSSRVLPGARLTGQGGLASAEAAPRPGVSQPPAAPPPAPPGAQAGQSEVEQGRAGPWGVLEYTRMKISPEPEFIQELAAPNTPSPWFFKNTTAEQLRNLLRSALLSSEQVERALARARPVPGKRGLEVLPDLELIKSLSPESREKLYGVLAMDNQNLDQINAFRVPTSIFQPWLGGLKLPGEAQDLIQRLSYRHGRFSFLADVPLVLAALPEPKLRMELLHELASEETYMIKMVLDERSDINALAEYWGRGGRVENVRPLLESVSKAIGIRRLDVIHLLPPFARVRLYTYPRPSQDPLQVAQDCHWTSANFFNDLPDPTFMDKAAMTRAVREGYYPIFAGPMFGDLVLYGRGDQVLHSAVFIADDMVFSKNGSRVSSPWMFMHHQSLLDYYQGDGPLKVQYMRPKSI